MKVATASWFYRVFNRLVDSGFSFRNEFSRRFRLLSAPVHHQLREFSKRLMPWTGYRSTHTRVARHVLLALAMPAASFRSR